LCCKKEVLKKRGSEDKRFGREEVLKNLTSSEAFFSEAGHQKLTSSEVLKIIRS
jgi:hypothetical protein